VDLSLHLRTGGRLRVRLAGDPLSGGGVAMRESAVTLVRDGTYQGRIDRLQGNVVEALVGRPDGRALRLRVVLDLGAGAVGGRLSARPVAGTGA